MKIQLSFFFSSNSESICTKLKFQVYLQKAFVYPQTHTYMQAHTQTQFTHWYLSEHTGKTFWS